MPGWQPGWCPDSSSPCVIHYSLVRPVQVGPAPPPGTNLFSGSDPFPAGRGSYMYQPVPDFRLWFKVHRVRGA